MSVCKLCGSYPPLNIKRFHFFFLYGFHPYGFLY